MDYNYLDIKYTTDSVKAKNVIVRADLDLPMDNNGDFTDLTRFNESITTIKNISAKANKVLILAHIGRPKSKDDKNLSTYKLSKMFSDKLGEIVEFISDIDQITESFKSTSKIYLLDNIRFFEGEETENVTIRSEFLENLVKGMDVFVNDAFASYRISASTYYIIDYLPSYIGDKFYSEVTSISKIFKPEMPFIGIFGGAKLSEKLDVISKIVSSVDKLIIGGAMAYTLLKAKGVEIGNSLFEPDKIEVAKNILNLAGEKLLLPIDHIVTKEFSPQSSISNTEDQNIPKNLIGIDIGTRTIDLYNNHIVTAKTIAWNGPMGVFEWESGIKGSSKIINSIIANKKAYKIAGGGDSISVLNKIGYSRGIEHISTGGGAMLSLIANKSLDVINKIKLSHGKIE